MDRILLKFWIFEITPLSLTFSVLIILITVFISLFVNRYLKKKKIEKFWLVPKGFLFAIIWIFALGLIFIFLTPKVDEFVVFKNKIFYVTLIRLIIIILIVFINLFVIRVLKLQSIKKGGILKNNTLRIIVDLIFWLLSFHFIFLLSVRNYSKLSNYKIIQFKSISITIYDIFFILISLTITGAVVVAIKMVLDSQVKKRKLDEATAHTIFKVSQYFIWTFAILIVLQTIGFNLSLILAGSAALLVGVGIGIQQIFNDIVSGIVLLFEQNLKVGDIVEVQGLVGKVMDIGFRTTTILTRDNIRIIIPNSKFTSENVINWTKGEHLTRFYVSVGVAYGSDTELVEKLLLEAAHEHPDIDKTIKPEVIFDNFGDSSLDFKLYFYTHKSFFVEAIKSDLRKKIDKKFREHNITIPFPQQDIYIKEIPSNPKK